MKLFAATLFLASLVSSQLAGADPVTVEFKALAQTVVDQPFGMEVPRLTVVRGSFTFESDAADQNGSDPRRGRFLLGVEAWDFRAEFLGRELTGSSQCEASTETFGHTLRFNDGNDDDDTGDMSLDGEPDSDIELSFSITGDEVDLPNDQLPERFKFFGEPHTFVIGDDSGRMLLQFEYYRQLPTDLRIKSIERLGEQVKVDWFSIRGRIYRVEFSTNLQDWETIVPSVVGKHGTTGIIDGVVSRVGEEIPRGYYRVRELVPEPR